MQGKRTEIQILCILLAANTARKELGFQTFNEKMSELLFVAIQEIKRYKLLYFLWYYYPKNY